MWGEMPFGVLQWNCFNWNGQSEDILNPISDIYFKLLKGEDSDYNFIHSYDLGMGYYGGNGQADHKRWADDCGVCRFPICIESGDNNPEDWIYDPCNETPIYRFICEGDNTGADADIICGQALEELGDNTIEPNILSTGDSVACGSGICISERINLVIANNEWNSTCK